MAEVLNWYPPVGIFIAILGVVGIVVPLVRDLAKMSKWEKAGWTAVMFILMGLEIRSIYLDRKAHDLEQKNARAELLQNFKDVGDGIKKEIDTSQTEFAATMKRSDTILGGVGENIKIANGGDIYAYIRMSPTNGGFDLYIIQDGNYHLLDANGRITDLDKFDVAVKAGQLMDRSKYEVALNPMPLLYRGRAVIVGTLPVPADSDYKRFNISLFARNGIFEELYRLKRVNGSWTSAMAVQVAYYNVKGGIACKRVDKQFPVELLEQDKDWSAYMKLPKFQVKGSRTCPKQQ